jgi:hypothetical protein
VRNTPKATKDILFTFDTTGSMYPCLTQVRRNVQEVVRSLFNGIDDLRIAIIAHGDYCDGADYMRTLDFTNQVEHICHFVATVPPT